MVEFTCLYVSSIQSLMDATVLIIKFTISMGGPQSFSSVTEGTKGREGVRRKNRVMKRAGS